MTTLALDRQEVAEIFSASVLRYFRGTSQGSPHIQTPYLAEENEPLQDFTAVIGISGDHKGCCFYTAPEAMLASIARNLGESRPDTGLLSDLAGEIANTISGNARADLGTGFMISVPVVLEGKPRHLRSPRGTLAIVLPIQWEAWTSHLIICLQNLQTE